MQYFIAALGLISTFNISFKYGKSEAYFDVSKKCFYDEAKLYDSEAGYHHQIYLTDKNSLLSKMVKNKTILDEENIYPFLWGNGIELLFGFSDEKIHTFNFTSYNPYDKGTNELFYICRLYLDSSRCEDEMYKKIYQKTCRRIRKYSIKLDGLYVKDYLYKGKK